jgi:hypothetical protein
VSNLRRQAATALADKIQSVLRLQQKPTVIAAPPSNVSEYASCAIWLENHQTQWYTEEEIQITRDGKPKIGARMDLKQSPAAMINSTASLSKIGIVQCDGRIWVGARHAPQREELEDRITRLFADDRTAPGRLLLSVKAPVIDGLELPWPWPVAVFTDSAEWSAEFAFTERLWSWIKFEMCVDLLVVRNDPRINMDFGGFQIAIDADFRQPYDETGVLDLDDGADTEYYALQADGSLKQV